MVEMVAASMRKVVNKMEKVTCIHRPVVREHCASYVSVMSDETYWRRGTLQLLIYPCKISRFFCFGPRYVRLKWRFQPASSR